MINYRLSEQREKRIALPAQNPEQPKVTPGAGVTATSGAGGLSLVTNVNKRDNRLGLEDDAMVVNAHVRYLHLLGKERHVIRQAQIMLFEGIGASLACDGHSPC